MIEPLGPNMARSLMGSAYNPEFKYELETDDAGFHIIVTNMQDGTSTSIELDPEPPDPERLSSVWANDLSERLPKKDLLSRMLFWCCIAAAVVCVVFVLLNQ